jgi:CheY-like chemotaxis protein
MVNEPQIKKVLMIDDDEDDCMVFKMALAETDKDVKFIFLNSCDGMVATIQETSPDLIFLDINLPRVNGLECLDLIKQSPNNKKIPVVMYSSSELPKDLAAAYEKGASLYFRKPNNIADLIEALTDILQMSWHSPETIKAQYYKNGRYFVYENKSLV